MSNLPEIILEHIEDWPELEEFILSGAWKEPFPPHLLGRNHSSAVVKLQLADLNNQFFDAEEDVIPFGIEALVMDASGKRMRVFLAFIDQSEEEHLHEDAVDFYNECTCMRGTNCVHGIAVLQYLAAHLSSPAPSTAQAARPAPLVAPPAVQNWLAQLEAAARPKIQTPAKAYNKFLAYCLQASREYDVYGRASDTRRNLYSFTLRVASTTKSGEIRFESYANADLVRIPRYLATEDMPICARLQVLRREIGSWGHETRIHQTDWQGILEPALATGRLFYLTSETKDTRTVGTAVRLHPGPPLTAHAGWQDLHGTSLQPRIELENPAAIVLPCLPLRYVCPQSCLFGSIRSETPDAVLLAWHEGPVVPAEAVPAVTKNIRETLKDTTLPAPKEQPSTAIQGTTPTPHLHIANEKLGFYLKPAILAHITIRYHDGPVECPPLPPLTPESPLEHTWYANGQRYVLKRNGKAEAEQLEMLETIGLQPLSRFFPAQETADRLRHCRVFCPPFEAKATAWLEFISSSDFQLLEQRGWTITSDPTLGLRIHDITGLATQLLPESDGEIDWFRFEVSAEANGARISLMPQIAHAIRNDWLDLYANRENQPAHLLLPCENIQDGHIRFPTDRFLAILRQVRHLFSQGDSPESTGAKRIDRLTAAGLADALEINESETLQSLAELGRRLRDLQSIPSADPPPTLQATLRPYQLDGFRWLQFLADHELHGVLADDMGLGKTLQTLAHIAAQNARHPGEPSLVVAPTSVVPNWAAEARKFTPSLKILTLHGADRADDFDSIPHADIVLTSYALLVRDIEILRATRWNTLVLDEAQYIKNPKALSSLHACRIKARHRICLSGTPMENHLGELWSLMRFLMPGFLGEEKTFQSTFRKPIEKEHCRHTQYALNRRVAPLVLRRTKDQVATDLPEKTILVHGIDLAPKQIDLYESVRAAMDKRVREAIQAKGAGQSHIIVLDALLKLRQICCHPQLLKTDEARRVDESAKLEFLTAELLPTLLEEGRRILLFSQFTSMLELIREHLVREQIPHLILTGATKDRASLVDQFQTGSFPLFLISLKAGGTGLNLTAADTVIHYDPWWNPAAENQATDRAHRIGQTKPVFVHKLVCRGTIEDRILQLQEKKAALVEALLSEETGQLRIDAETLSHLLSPLQSD
jgi:hypothetical protein